VNVGGDRIVDIHVRHPGNATAPLPEIGSCFANFETLDSPAVRDFDIFGQPAPAPHAAGEAGEVGAHPAVAPADPRLIDGMRDQALAFRTQLARLHDRALEIGGLAELVAVTGRHIVEAERVIAVLDENRA
jgi:hypothetical protein